MVQPEPETSPSFINLGRLIVETTRTNKPNLNCSIIIPEKSRGLEAPMIVPQQINAL